MTPKILRLHRLETDRQTDRQTEQKLDHSQAVPSVRPSHASTDAASFPDPRLLLAALRAEHVCWRQPCFLCAILSNDPVSDEALRDLVATDPRASAVPFDPIVVDGLGHMLAWLQAGARERHTAHQQLLAHTTARNVARARLAAHVPETDPLTRRLRVAMCQLITKRPATTKLLVRRPAVKKSSR